MPLQLELLDGPYRSNVIDPDPVRSTVPLKLAESLTVEPRATLPDGVVEIDGLTGDTTTDSAPQLLETE